MGILVNKKGEIMNVLSLFNGMSFGMMALESLNIKVDKYYSSEIDKYANQATQVMFPDIVQLGDVTKWKEWDIDLGSIDLLLAGFPCQAWSMAGKQNGDSDPRGALVHDLIAIWGEIKKHNPDVKFMFENVKMKKEFLDYINNLFGIEPVCINSALVSAQNRVRYYWTNIGKIEQPEDKGILLKDIIEKGVVDNKYILSDKLVQGFYNKKGSFNGRFNPMDAETKEKSFCLTARYYKCGSTDPYVRCGAMRGRYLIDGKRADNKVESQKGLTEQRIELRKDDKTNCLTTVQKDNLVVNKEYYRRLTPRECFRLQTVPEHHINTLLNSGISNTQLYKMCGNGWTMEVIAHIFKGLNQQSQQD